MLNHSTVNSWYDLNKAAQAIDPSMQAARKVLTSDVIETLETIFCLYEQADEKSAPIMGRMMIELHKELNDARRTVWEAYSYNNNFTAFMTNAVKLSSEIFAEFCKEFHFNP